VDDHLSVNARFAAWTEDFDDHAFAVIGVTGKAHHLDDDFVTGPTVFSAGIADKNRRIKCAAIDEHQPETSSFAISSNESIRSAADNFDDFARAALVAAGASARQPSDHAIAAGCVEDFSRGYKEVLAAVARHGAVGNDKAITGSCAA
jgi:hypothetical protein